MPRARRPLSRSPDHQLAILGVFACLVAATAATWNASPPIAVQPVSVPALGEGGSEWEGSMVRPVVRIGSRALTVDLHVACDDGCDRAPPEPVSLPCAGECGVDTLDVDALTRVLENAREAWPQGQIAEVIPLPGTQMQTIVAVIDVVRGPEEDLFREVQLAAR